MPLLPLSPSLEAAWDDLADRCAASPFVRPGWTNAWHRAFGRGRLLLMTEAAGGDLAACVPMVQVRGRLQSPTNWHTPEFEVFGLDAIAVAGLLAGLVRQPAREVDLSHLAAATSQELERSARSISRLTVGWQQQDSPYIETAAGWDRYVAQLDARWLRKLTRRRRALEQQGSVSFEVHDGKKDLDAILHEGFELEARGWKGQTGTAVTANSVTRQFYWEVSRWSADRDWLRLAFLRLDGRAIAFNFTIEDGARHYSMKSGFDPALRSFGLGLILKFLMVERAFGLGIASYEMLGAPEPWKLAFTSTTRPRFRLRAFSPTPMGRLGWALQAYARPMAKSVMHHSLRVRRRLRR